MDVGDGGNDTDHNDDEMDALGGWCITLGGTGWHASVDIQKLKRTHHMVIFIMMIIATVIIDESHFQPMPDDTWKCG